MLILYSVSCFLSIRLNTERGMIPITGRCVHVIYLDCACTLFNLTPSSGFKKSSFSDMTHNNHKRLTETGKLLLGTKRLLATPKIEHVVGILLDLFGESGIPPLFCFYYATTHADSAHCREVKVRLEMCLAF